MSGAEILQTVGIILMVEGSIIALIELWRKRLDKLVKKSLNEAIDAMKDFLTVLINMGLEIKRKEKEEKDTTLSEEETQALIDTETLFLYKHFRRKAIEKIRAHLIHIGILYIILGATIQYDSATFWQLEGGLISRCIYGI